MNQNQNVTEVEGVIMDKQLAEIYGTGQPEVDESDLEKTAAAELLVKLAEEQGVDLNDFSDEEVGEMLGDLYEGGGVEHTAEAQEKYAEADYLGRIMAHSMVQELDSIEKEAGAKWDAVKGGAGKVKDYIKGRPDAYRAFGTGVKASATGKTPFGQRLPAKQRLKILGEAAREAAPEAGLIAGGVGGGIAAAKMKKKKASAVETLAEQRAYELAAEAGYIDKEASALDQVVEHRALEICAANGIPVEWNG